MRPLLLTVLAVAWLLGPLGGQPTGGARLVVVDVESGSFYFEDATPDDGVIEAKVGDQLRIYIADGGSGTRHTVEIPALGISSGGGLAPGSTYVTPALSEAGTFALYCKPHRARGHETTLVVSGGTTTTTTTTTSTTTTTTTTAVSTTTTTVPATASTDAPEATEPPTAGTPPTSSSVTSTSTTAPQVVVTPSTVPQGDHDVTSTTSGPGAASIPDDADLLPVGVVDAPGPPVWLRSVWVGLGAGPVLLLLAVATLRRRGDFT